MGRPVEHDESTGAALLDAAEAILAEESADSISVRRVANAVGVTTRAVYTTFGGKDGLLAELASRGHLMLGQLLIECGFKDDPIEDLISIGINGFRRFATSKPHLYRLSFERTPIAVTTNQKVIAAAKPGLELLIAHFKRAQDCNALQPKEPKYLALTFHALCVGLANWELSLKPPPVGSGMGMKLPESATEGIWRDGITALLNGFSPDSGVLAKYTAARPRGDSNSRQAKRG